MMLRQYGLSAAHFPLPYLQQHSGQNHQRAKQGQPPVFGKAGDQVAKNRSQTETYRNGNNQRRRTEINQRLNKRMAIHDVPPAIPADVAYSDAPALRGFRRHK